MAFIIYRDLNSKITTMNTRFDFRISVSFSAVLKRHIYIYILGSFILLFVSDDLDAVVLNDAS